MASRSLRRFVEQELGKFPHFLLYAVLEWVLIILLFIDGFLAFLANEFARFFELKIPCLLCTRIDHVLVRRNPDFYYNDSICEGHKKDVSYLAYCHVHCKLSDIRRMCEGCLLSFATGKESDCDTYKSLVGILHKDLECFVEDDHNINLKLPAGKKDNVVQAENSGDNQCSCCGNPLKVKSSYSKGIVNGPGARGSISSPAPAPSPRAPFVMLKSEESRNLDLPHIQYSELKFTPDNEAELPEDEYGLSGLNRVREDVKAATVPLLTESEDLSEDANKTPTFSRGNKFFGIPLTDSASASPRWATRFPRKSPLEKMELASVSVEATAANEADGESILHRLKRQVRLDRKSLMALYMELDEERSASAVAANNAMAMITRLQAEKAAVQMEALQYQRMMEEQAEYDQEALQVMRDLLTKREEEIKLLEAEIEEYREKYGCLREEGIEDCDGADEGYLKLNPQSHSSFSEKSECIDPAFSSNDHNSDRVRSSKKENGRESLFKSLLDLEGEKSYLLGHLKTLEKKLHLSSNDAVRSSESSTDTVDPNDGDRGVGSKAILTREVTHLSERMKALEADSGFLKHAAQTLEENGSEGTALLTEIAQHLRKLRNYVKMPLEDLDA